MTHDEPNGDLRVDDLARETGLTVDTIRYYQREGLLPPGRREGRHRVYGAEHVRRLTRIKELQARRFSIAAIRALVTGDETHLEDVFADEGEDLRLSLEELVERAGASTELVAELQDAGVLRDPVEFGRTTYDGDDLEMLRGLVRLEHAGIPTRALRTIAEIYGEGIEATQRRVVEIFVGGGSADWEPDERERFQAVVAAQPDALLPAMRRLVDYTHHRTIQRLTLDAVGADAPAEAIDPDATDPTLEIAI
jgi:DNA-binding transcriptional MerR regulator